MKPSSQRAIFDFHLTDPPSRLREFFANLGAALARPAQIEIPEGPLPLPYEEIGRGALPGRGILYSSVLHEIILVLIFVVPAVLPETVPVRKREYERQWLDTKLTYSLPALGGGREGGGRAGGKSGGGSGQRAGRPSAPREGARGTRGLVYPAPQPVVSNPSRPTNRIQTVLQPDIPKPPELKVPVPLPNLVQIARPRTPAPPPIIPKIQIEREPTPQAPQLQARLQPQRVPLTIRATAPAPLPAEPKLALPVAPVETSMPNLPPRPKTEVKPVIPQLNRAATEPAPSAPDVSLAANPRGTDDRTLLALSPFPAPPEERPQVPVGEARGQFAMGPEPNLAGSGLGTPGAAAQSDSSSASDAAGTGAGTGTGAGSSGSGPGSGPGGTGAGGTGTGSGIAGTGEGSGGGSGPGSGGGTGGGTGAGSGSGEGAAIGPGSGGSGGGVGTGSGSGSGPGRGSGTGTGTGTGSGAGAGPGTGPFEGISVAGGTTTGRAAAPPAGRTPADSGPRPTYGLTVTSTASSGGGLRDYGIFRNESVFTVYIEMTHSPTRAPSWILQYAQLRRPAASGAPPGPSGGSIRLGSQVVPPYPVTKENPEFPRDVVARNLGKLVVVYGEINGEGRVENTRIIQSPNPLLNRPALDALKKWEFRPAEADGAPVPVKVLVGIPLSLPPE